MRPRIPKPKPKLRDTMTNPTEMAPPQMTPPTPPAPPPGPEPKKQDRRRRLKKKFSWETATKEIKRLQRTIVTPEEFSEDVARRVENVETEAQKAADAVRREVARLQQADPAEEAAKINTNARKRIADVLESLPQDHRDALTLLLGDLDKE